MNKLTIKSDCDEVECSKQVFAQAQPVMVKADASFPHIREFQGLDDEEKENLEQRLIMESENTTIEVLYSLQQILWLIRAYSLEETGAHSKKGLRL